MAQPLLLRQLRQGVATWNGWRRAHPRQSIDLRGADLHGLALGRSNLGLADLERAWLAGSDLSRANLTGACLRGADLRGACLRAANLSQADLRQARLDGADLRAARLSGALCQGASFERADLTGAWLDGLVAADLAGASGWLGPAGVSGKKERDDVGW